MSRASRIPSSMFHHVHQQKPYIMFDPITIMKLINLFVNQVSAKRSIVWGKHDGWEGEQLLHECDGVRDGVVGCGDERANVLRCETCGESMRLLREKRRKHDPYRLLHGGVKPEKQGHELFPQSENSLPLPSRSC